MRTDTLIYSLASAIRFWRGTVVNSPRKAMPAQLLKLYDMEGCPYCRLVREQLTELDLDVMILPCPKKGSRFRAEAQRIGGKQQFPFLIDDNTGTQLYGSDAIMDYLHQTYPSDEAGPPMFRPLAHATSKLASMLVIAVLGMAGLKRRPSKEAAQPLELYAFESSPFSKPVRARLCELELPYILRNSGKGAWKEVGRATLGGEDNLQATQGSTINRDALARHTGRVQVPYLVDANTGEALFESLDIVRYLDRTYSLKTATQAQAAT